MECAKAHSTRPGDNAMKKHDVSEAVSNMLIFSSLSVALMVGLAVYGFYTSLGGQSLLGDRLLEDE